MGAKATKFDAKNVKRRYIYSTNETVRKKRIQHAINAKNKKLNSKPAIQELSAADPSINTVNASEQKQTGLFTSFKNFLRRLIND